MSNRREGKCAGKSRNVDADRRLFLKAGAALLSGTALGEGVVPSIANGQQQAASKRLTVGVMGLNGRGGALTKLLLARDDVDVAHLCDVDTNVLASAKRVVTEARGDAPQTHGDIREMVKLDNLDAIFVAAPNHWHAPAAIMACNAGKHVYVEKPCSHNPAEGEEAVAAARRNKRIVQTGTQRRSWPAIIEGIERLHAGEIGEIHYARCWYNNRRGSIGKGKETPPPARLDWDLWQGPAPRRQFKDNFVPYNWHWHWAWGNGELGNNGVHGLDLVRWGMQLTYPTRVSAAGGKYRHEDSQETPDTLSVSYQFEDDRFVTWQGLSWSPLGEHDTSFGMSFHGTEGTMVMRSTGYVLYDMKRNEVAANPGKANDAVHVANFLECIESGELPNADIKIGHDSALWCHLGNIAYRSEQELDIDSDSGRIRDEDLARKYWGRVYEPGWELA